MTLDPDGTDLSNCTWHLVGIRCLTPTQELARFPAKYDTEKPDSFPQAIAALMAHFCIVDRD